MYKSRLQELCQRRSWNLPEYTTVKDGLDHIPRFKATCVVNGQNFETPAECKSSKDAQNTVARLAFEFFNTPTPPRLHRPLTTSAGSAVIQQPLITASSPPPAAHVPEMQAVVPISPPPRLHRPLSTSAGSAVIQPLITASSPPPAAHVPEMQAVVPISPPPSSLPVPAPGLLAPNNSAHIKPVSNDMMQPNFGDTTQTSTVYRTSIGSNGLLAPNNSAHIKPVSNDMMLPNFGDTTQTSTVYRTSIGSNVSGTPQMYKNRLQQYTQKKNFSLPVYTCESEGPPHARRFKSRVSFGGKSYETVEFFPSLKEAEHAAAKVACLMLPVDQIQEERGLFKNLLQELAQKRGLLCPTYETVISGPPHRPIFVSIVEVGSSTFRGDEAKTKKQAEMNAATTAYYALTEYSLVTECSKASSSMDYVVSADLTQNILPIETIEKDEFVANECVSDDLMQNILPIETMKSDEFAANEDSLITECSKASSSMETMKNYELVANICVVSSGLTQNILPIETIEKDEFVANECVVVSDDLTQNILPIETMKSDEFAANEDEINAKRVKCSPANETTNLLALPLQDSPFEVSSGQVEHQAATDPVAEQPIEVQSRFCTKTVVFPRKSNLPIPEGASVMPYSDDQWVAYKVELNQEPNA